MRHLEAAKTEFYHGQSLALFVLEKAKGKFERKRFWCFHLICSVIIIKFNCMYEMTLQFQFKSFE